MTSKAPKHIRSKTIDATSELEFSDLGVSLYHVSLSDVRTKKVHLTAADKRDTSMMALSGHVLNQRTIYEALDTVVIWEPAPDTAFKLLAAPCLDRLEVSECISALVASGAFEGSQLDGASYSISTRDTHLATLERLEDLGIVEAIAKSERGSSWRITPWGVRHDRAMLRPR